jgi:EmrB/QacA subfamily drug resistance transporter
MSVHSPRLSRRGERDEFALGGATVLARHRVRPNLVLLILSVTVLIINLDGTILNVALPKIVSSLHASASQLQWIVDAYAVVLAGLLLIAGTLGDHVGRKWIFVVGLVIFAAGSAMSAFATTTASLIGARAFMGIGAAAIMPSTLSILTNVFTEPSERARAIGLWSGTNGLGLAIGPTVGGWLLAHYWWGSVFLINVPIAAVTGLAALYLVPNSKNAHAKAPDLVGAAASLVGIGLLLWAIIEGPGRGWASPAIVGALGASALLLIGLVFWERRSDHPLLELSFFRRARFSVAMGALALTIFALSGAMFLLTQYLQFVLGYSALETGLRITPIAIVLLVVAATSSYVVRLVGTKPVVFSGMILIAVGLGRLSELGVHSTYATALPAFFLLGIGTGLAVAPSTESVMGSVPTELAGVGSATNSTALQIGGALGVAVMGSLLNTHYRTLMLGVVSHAGLPAALSHASLGSVAGAFASGHFLGASAAAHLAESAKASYVSAMDFSFDVGAVIVAMAALIVVVSLPSRADRPEGSLFSDLGGPMS